MGKAKERKVKKAPTVDTMYKKALDKVQQAQALFDVSKERLEKARAELIVLVSTKKEGSTKKTIGKFDVTTVGKMIYKVEVDELDDVEEKLPEDVFEKLFAFKADVRVKYLKELREHNKKLYKIASKCISSTPAKDTLTIKEKKEK